MKQYEHGGNIYKQRVELDFSANVNCFGMPKPVLRAAKEGVKQAIHYPDPQCMALKQAITQLENGKVREEQIICGNGASDLIYQLVRTLAPGKITVPAPGFHEYEQAFSSQMGCGEKIEYLRASEKQGFAITVNEIQKISADTDLVFLCNPGNPTGILMEQEALELALLKSREDGFFLCIDETFLEFVSQEKPNSLVENIHDYENLFVLKAFTKMYAMAGLRLGYGICGNTKLLRKMEESTQPWNISLPAQKAGVTACGQRQFVRNTVRWLQRERAYMTEALQRLGYVVYPGCANYLLFFGPAGLGEYCLSHGILMRDCSNYRGLGKGYYRIVIRKRRDNNRLLKCMEAFRASVEVTEKG